MLGVIAIFFLEMSVVREHNCIFIDGILTSNLIKEFLPKTTWLIL